MKKIIYIITLLTICNYSFADLLRFNHITVKDGLSQSTVRCIYQDYQGFLWIGTGDGLNQFDGYRFKHYLCDPTNSNSISDYDIACIVEMSVDSNLWIGTRRNGLSLFNRELETFTSFKKSDTITGSISGNNIKALLCDQNQRLWIASSDGGLCYLNPRDTSFVHVNFKNTSNLSSIYSITNDPNGNLWIGTNKGLYKWKNVDILTSKEPELIALENYKSGNQITSLCFDFRGNLWVGTNGSGLFKHHPISGQTKQYLAHVDTQKVGSYLISEIIQTKIGMIWVATSDGLFAYSKESDRFISFKNDPDNKESLNSNNLLCLFEDDSSILWVGTFVHGLNKMDPLYKRFQNFGHLVLPEDRKPERNDIRSICKVNNKLWVGTSNGLLETSPVPIYYSPGKSTTIHLRDKFINTIIFNKSYGLFVNADKDIYHYNSQGHFISLSSQIYKQTGISDWTVYDAIVDIEKNNWYATSIGLLRHNPESNTFALKNPVDDSGKPIQEIFVSIYEDYKGKLWLGSFKGTLYTYDRNTNVFKQVSTHSKSGQEFIFSRIFSIHESDHGILWLGTNQGLYRYNNNDQSTKRYLDSDGLPNNIVYSVLGDSEDRIWCSTNKGITCYNIKDEIFTNFYYEDGLQNNEFNQGAYFKDIDGTIYLGGIEGLNSFNPNHIKLNSFTPSVIISKIEINYHSITPATNPELLSKQISSTRQISLNHKQNTISFEFNAISFSLPQKIKYKYCLTKEGNHDKWIESDTRRFASFINIPPGTYTFKVKSSNSDGIWNDNYSALNITIAPPFWSTWWFRISIVLFILMVLYLYIQLRIKTIQKQNFKLEQIVKDKTNKLTLQKEQIEQQNQKLISINSRLNSTNENIQTKNKQLKNQHAEIVNQRNNLLKMAEQVEEANQAKIRFFTSLSHELRTPLTLIINPIKDIITHIEDINQYDLKRQLATIDGNASKLLLIVNQLLDFRKVESNSIQMNISQFDLVAFVKQTAYLFNDMAKQYTFIFKTDFTKLLIWADMEKIEKVIFNLLSNAFKYTPEKGQIEIKVSAAYSLQGKKSATISVSDNGEGIEQDQIQYIFDPFFELNKSSYSKQSSSGLGLAITKQYVDLHNGDITVASSPLQGSNFIVFLPFGKQHFNENVRFIDNSEYIIESLPIPVNDYISNPLNNILASTNEDRPSILLIEDDKNLRLYIRDILSTLYKVETANNGKDGIQMAENRQPDLVISDIMLPDIKGFEICQHIKSEFNTSHIPVILLTALADDESQLNGIEAGADAYISKPFDLKKLTLTIENLLTNRKRIQQKFVNGTTMEDIEICNSEDQLFLKNALKIVEENLSEPDFDVNALCNSLGYSQPQVYRKIKALTDLSIAEFIRNIRLKKAVQLLKTRKFKVNQVAYEVGFSQPSYFTKCFSQLYGQKPSDFIK